MAGSVSACWAPLIPFAKIRLGVNDAQLGLLLLSFGVGSLLGVGVAGLFAARIGPRPLVLAGGLGLCLLLPALSVAASPVTLGAALFAFGAAMGALDVAMNAHGVEVEKAAGVSLMSGFHALFSLGGFAGAAWITLSLRSNVSAPAATIVASLAGACLIAAAATGMLAARPAGQRPALFVWPSGLVAVIAILAATMFLAEGAVYDWSALLMVDREVASRADAGVGFILFSIAMTAGRVSGDRVVRRLGARRVLQWGGALAILGLVWVLACPFAPLAAAGFLLVGLGAANVVPVLFSAAGRQTSMPPTLAVAAVTSTAYAGVLAGPPGLGFVAHAVGLPAAFWLLAGLLLLVPLLARTTAA
ncbi:MAG TPA: MFS transporter [Caulobacteraceae bacterium]|nr:MFS transporter [Caulobacteraceae bacterium]